MITTSKAVMAQQQTGGALHTLWSPDKSMMAWLNFKKVSKVSRCYFLCTVDWAAIHQGVPAAPE